MYLGYPAYAQSFFYSIFAFSPLLFENGRKEIKWSVKKEAGARDWERRKMCCQSFLSDIYRKTEQQEGGKEMEWKICEHSSLCSTMLSSSKKWCSVVQWHRESKRAFETDTICETWKIGSGVYYNRTFLMSRDCVRASLCGEQLGFQTKGTENIGIKNVVTASHKNHFWRCFAKFSPVI